MVLWTIYIEICFACVSWMRANEYLLLFVRLGFGVLTGNRQLFKCIQNYSISSVFCGSSGNKEKNGTIQRVSLFHEHGNIFLTVLNLYMTKRKTVTLKTVHFRELKAWEMWWIIQWLSLFFSLCLLCLQVTDRLSVCPLVLGMNPADYRLS